MRYLLLLCLSLASLFAATPPQNFTETVIASGLSSPTAMAFAPDGRIFILQQAGALRIYKDGALLATPALSLTVDSSGERGLLGIAFDPAFPTNNFVYLYYTLTTSPRRNRVSRFTMTGDTAGSELVLLELNNLSDTATNHNGGALHFGLDGKLYIAVGDNATGTNAQSFANLLGKILRMNPDGTTPSDNPYFNDNTVIGQNKLIWNYGLRNPFTFAVQSTTGRIFINDVGQNTWEEINDGLVGANYGWPATEGATSNPLYKTPTYTYNHANQFGGGFSCAITGGAFYNPPNNSFPASYTGRYFFADYCGGWIATFDPATSTAAPFLTGGSSIVDIRVHPDGSLYYLQRGGGQILRIAYTGALAPSITTHPQSQTVSVGLNATFTVVASGNNLSYQWQRNSANIPGATAASYTLNNVNLTDSGSQFRVIVTNPSGAVTSNAATLTVSSNQPPSASITAPATFIGGQTINFSGSATDPESGSLPASALVWRVDYHTGAAVRPFVNEFTNATGGSWLVPQITPYLLTDVFFRIHLTATDPQGNATTVTRDVLPVVSTFTIQTNPTGLSFTLDGVPFTSTQVVPSVVNLIRPIATTTPQGSSSTRYNFLSWSDGGAISHNITVPASNTTYTAAFQTQHLLTTSVNPAGSGTITPATGFFNAGTIVNLTATPNAGWQFSNFSGPVNGATVTVDAPKSVVANFVALSPGSLTLSVQSKSGTGAQRTWQLLISNPGQTALTNARIAAIAIEVKGQGSITLLTPLPVALGTLAAGANVAVPITFDWADTKTKARIIFTLAGDPNYSTNVAINNATR